MLLLLALYLLHPLCTTLFGLMLLHIFLITSGDNGLHSWYSFLPVL